MAVMLEEKYRRLSGADHIFQGQVKSVEISAEELGSSRVEIEVLELASNTPGVAIGDIVTFSVTTWRGSPPPGDYYFDAQKLYGWSLVEVYLEKMSDGSFYAPHVAEIESLGSLPSALVSMLDQIEENKRRRNAEEAARPQGLRGLIRKLFG